ELRRRRSESFLAVRTVGPCLPHAILDAKNQARWPLTILPSAIRINFRPLNRTRLPRRKMIRLLPDPEKRIDSRRRAEQLARDPNYPTGSFLLMRAETTGICREAGPCGSRLWFAGKKRRSFGSGPPHQREGNRAGE